MRAVGLKVLKNKLSEYVRLAAAGETVLIADRDRVVAELGPPSEGRARAAGCAARGRGAGGLVTPAALPPGPPPETKPVAPLAELLAELEADRADR